MTGLPDLPFSNEDVRAAFSDETVVVPALGQGSFKVAYRISVPDIDQVLKIIYHFPIDDENGEFGLDQIPDRIARELEGMNAVSCPHIVTLLSGPEVVRIGGVGYLSYREPFYGGGTLEDRLREGPLSRDETRSILIALLRASSALWDAGRIVHRDIKPGNIAFAEDGTLVLLDLGLVLFTEMSALTDSRDASPMTPRYAAPEQFELRRDVQIDFRTDQYLIGLTVLEAARGRHPFFHEGILFSEYLKAMEEFSPADLAGDDLHDDVREVLGRLLSFPIYRRYRSPEMPIEKLGVSQ